MQAIEAGTDTNGSDAEDVYATLRDMVEDGTVPGIRSLAALRKAAQIPGFPAPVPMPGGYEYSRRAVVDFLANRPRKRRRPTRGWLYVLCGGGEPALQELGRICPGQDRLHDP